MSAWRTSFQAGLAAIQVQDWPQAQAAFERGLTEAVGSASAAETAEIYHEWAYAAFKDGQVQLAEQAYRSALALVPDSVEDLNNLALLLQKRAPEQALALLEQALAQPGLPPPLELQLRLNWVETGKQSQPEKAFAWLQQALARFPQETRLHVYLAEMAENWLQYPLVIQHIYAALAQLPAWSAPTRAACWRRLARAYQATGEIDRAHWALENAQTSWPNPAYLLEKALLLPQLYRSPAEVGIWRKTTETALEDLLNGPPLVIPQPHESLQTAPFYLAFQGLNDRPLLEKLAEIYQRFLPPLLACRLSARPGPPTPTATGPIRIGFVSHFFFEHSVLHLFEGLITGLDPAQFEVTVFAVAPVFQDKRTQQLAEKVAHFIALEGPLEAMLAQIQASQLAVLVYTDLGSDPFTWLLAQYRLAPLQLVLPGIMHTTGFKTLDYYLSPDCMEPPNAEAHYTETLVRLRSLPVMPIQPQRQGPLLSREALGLPPDRRVYLCPMTPFKFHPDFDAVLTTILAEDPLAEIWILQHRQDGICQLLLQRLTNTLKQVLPEDWPEAASRLKLAPWFAQNRFWHLLEQVDVVLDSWPVGGGNTVFTCLGLGVPLVSWASPFFRGRVASGAYALMGIADPPVAQSAAECAQLALKLAQAPLWRAALQSEILAKNGVLFENPATLAEFSNFVIEKVLALNGESV